jgi:hypothetical protein
LVFLADHLALTLVEQTVFGEQRLESPGADAPGRITVFVYTEVHNG